MSSTLKDIEYSLGGASTPAATAAKRTPVQRTISSNGSSGALKRALSRRRITRTKSEGGTGFRAAMTRARVSTRPDKKVVKRSVSHAEGGLEITKGVSDTVLASLVKPLVEEMDLSVTVTTPVAKQQSVSDGRHHKSRSPSTRRESDKDKTARLSPRRSRSMRKLQSRVSSRELGADKERSRRPTPKRSSSKKKLQSRVSDEELAADKETTSRPTPKRSSSKKKLQSRVSGEELGASEKRALRPSPKRSSSKKKLQSRSSDEELGSSLSKKPKSKKGSLSPKRPSGKARTISPKRSSKKDAAMEDSKKRIPSLTLLSLDETDDSENQEEPPATWICVCGYELADCMQFCGLCATSKYWKCTGCNFDQNPCMFKFCGACGGDKPVSRPSSPRSKKNNQQGGMPSSPSSVVVTANIPHL